MKTESESNRWSSNYLINFIVSVILFLLVALGPLILVAIFRDMIYEARCVYQVIIILATIAYYFIGIARAIVKDAEETFPHGA